MSDAREYRPARALRTTNAWRRRRADASPAGMANSPDETAENTAPLHSRLLDDRFLDADPAAVNDTSRAAASPRDAAL